MPESVKSSAVETKSYIMMHLDCARCDIIFILVFIEEVKMCFTIQIGIKKKPLLKYSKNDFLIYITKLFFL